LVTASTGGEDVEVEDADPAIEQERKDLSGEDDRASQGGVSRPEELPPPPDHIRRVASYLLLIFGVSIVLILLLTTAIAWWRADALKDVVGFFGTVVATLGTLLGGVVAFYFARR
jgi:hypothetical protein